MKYVQNENQDRRHRITMRKPMVDWKQ